MTMTCNLFQAPNGIVAKSCAAIAFALAASASAQGLPTWRVDIGKADAGYAETATQAAERYRLEKVEAGLRWLEAYDREIERATKAGDAMRAARLAAVVDAAREANRVPEAPPGNVVEFGRHRYAFIDEPMAWHAAKARCERMGGHLVTIESPAEEAFLVKTFGDASFHIGASELWTPGVNTSIDGKPFRAWQFPIVNNDEYSHILIWFARKREWNDDYEGQRWPFVCEWER